MSTCGRDSQTFRPGSVARVKYKTYFSYNSSPKFRDGDITHVNLSLSMFNSALTNITQPVSRYCTFIIVSSCKAAIDRSLLHKC